MFETLFGIELPLAARFFIAFLAVLALIALTAWLVRRFGSNRLGGATRGRQPRLAVIDAASVDGRRRLILIRRDNIEHLLMVGGPTDVVVEQNIVRAAAARDTGPRAPAADTLPRAIPLADAGAWPLQPEPLAGNGSAPIAPAPAAMPATMQITPQAAPPRAPYRAAVTEEPWVPPEPTRTRADAPPAPPQTEFVPPPVARNAPPVVAPTREPAAEAAPAVPPQTDRNLAEMAQRLEAALRHPGTAEPHPPVSDALAAAATAKEPRVPMPPMSSRERPAPRPAPETKPAAPAKSAFDNLEQEMANLLGRPSGKM
ncbi:MAG: flagellar biosynthetic protein FliO [Pseudolabrys sp.]|nr:flagellar biosynthetic protein FliO [Pseudolabrys sp.]